MVEGQVAMGLNKSCILLIVIAGMERFAFKGVASNLVTYLTDVMEMNNSSAAKFVNSWIGFTSMLPLVVAMLVDSYWDRYRTIFASSILYAAGLIALTSTGLATSKISSITSLSWSLYMISLGQGGYNPSLQAFGADQLENEDELPLTTNSNNKASDNKSLFFQWWYFGVCCGSLLGVSVMSYIQDNFGWGLGFAIPAFTMIASIVMFLCGKGSYTQKKEDKKVDAKSLEEIFKSLKDKLSNIISRNVKPSHEYVAVELQLQEKPLCNEDSDQDIPCFGPDHDQRTNSIQSLKMILRLLPVWLMLLMFAVIFQQPATFFTKQGMTMKRNIGPKFKIPPAALQSSITVSIILLMPWYDTFFIPLIRIFTKNEKGITVMQRMGIGMVLSIIAMVIAAIMETRRLEISKNMAVKSEEVPFNIFWLLPQYVLLGISDIFTVVGMQEFFYSEVPVKMRTMGIALYTSVFGVGSFLSAILISLIEYLTSNGGRSDSWFSDDMRKARLDYYYWFLALSSVSSFLAFVIFCRFFRDRT